MDSSTETRDISSSVFLPNGKATWFLAGETKIAQLVRAYRSKSQEKRKTKKFGVQPTQWDRSRAIER